MFLSATPCAKSIPHLSKSTLGGMISVLGSAIPSGKKGQIPPSNNIREPHCLSIQYPQALSYHVPRVKLSPFYDVHIFDTDEHILFPISY